MASYICPSCKIDFGYPQGLAIHNDIGCEWGDDYYDGTNYCCGMMYEDGELACNSCGEPL